MFLYKLNQLINSHSAIIFPSKQARRVEIWKKANGDLTLRLDYKLNEKSIVFDLGGYQGQWTSDIFSKYRSRIYVFEPVREYADFIKNRFKQNKKISVYNYGLSEENKTLDIYLNNESTSIIKQTSDKEKIKLVKFSDFIKKYEISSIDLIKINIEGAEYDLMDHIIETDFISKIKNVQIQFHDFILDAEDRRKNIQDKLKKTHISTYSYPFVWENWRSKNDNS